MANVYATVRLGSSLESMDNIPGGDTPPGKGGSSLRHVAQLAGVSVATASRVISGSSHPVSEATRERVLLAADRLAFQPNRLARALVTARSQTIGVLVHDISDPYFGEIVKGLEDGIHTEDYRLFVASSERDPDKELSYVQAFIAHQVDAIVFAASALTNARYERSLTDLIEGFVARNGVVLILSDHTLQGPRVIFDNKGATAQMVDYLASQGHETIGYIAGPEDLEVSKVRLEGFTEAVERLGLDARPELVTSGSFSVGGGGEAMERLLDAAPDVTAVLTANDMMAIGATRYLLANGRRVPEDISVAGFDDVPMAEYGPVPLTTMRVPTYEIGSEGARLLLSALHDDSLKESTVSGQIIVRESVAPRKLS